MKRKKRILCIIGHSGSGKTFFERMLTRTYPNYFNRIVSYTTRPMREGETEGIEHHFVSEDQIPDHKQMLAYTRYGDYEYWADASDLEDFKTNTYVIDVEGYRYLKHYFADDYDIRVVYIKRSVRTGIDLQRQQRDRGRMVLNPDEIDCIIRNEGSKIDLYDTMRNHIAPYLFRIFSDNSNEQQQQ